MALDRETHVLKSIRFSIDMDKEITALSEKNCRSFTGQVIFMLEDYLERNFGPVQE